MCLLACTQASTLVHLRVHAKAVCVCVCGRGDGGGGGSKSAVIQALLSLLNDDVNL